MLCDFTPGLPLSLSGCFRRTHAHCAKGSRHLRRIPLSDQSDFWSRTGTENESLNKSTLSNDNLVRSFHATFMQPPQPIALLRSKAILSPSQTGCRSFPRPRIHEATFGSVAPSASFTSSRPSCPSACAPHCLRRADQGAHGAVAVAN